MPADDTDNKGKLINIIYEIIEPAMPYIYFI